MSAATMDQDALATLTPEEREAIEGSEHSPEELEAMKRIAGDAGDDDAEDEDEDGDEDGDETDDDAGAGADDADPAPGAAPAADTPAADAPAPAADAAARVPGPVAVTYTADLPADYEDQVRGLADTESEAWAKFEAGDIDQADLQRQLREVMTKRAELDTARLKNEIFQDMRVQTEQATFQATVHTFADSVQAQVDYRKDADKLADLDAFMKRLAQDEANADKSTQWFLAEAHKRVLALHGMAAVAAPKAGPDAAKAAAAARKPPVGNAPVTLAQVPGGDGPGDIGGEFAHLDALEGDELESAISRMTPAQRAKFAQGR